MFEYKSIKITKSIQSGFRLATPDCILYIDPFRLTKETKDADIIFITHEHKDHCDLESIEKIARDGAIIMGNKLVRETIGDLADKYQFIEIDPCSSGAVDALDFSCTSAYNLDKWRPDHSRLYHPKENEGVGFILEIETPEGRVKIWHMGDTDFLLEHELVADIDILMIPVSGTYVMTANEAVICADKLKPKVAIPMHYDAGVVGSIEDARLFEKGFHGETKIL